jgi:hypothetical protein
MTTKCSIKIVALSAASCGPTRHLSLLKTLNAEKLLDFFGFRSFE